MIHRIIRAARLDPAFYRQAFENRDLNTEAMLIAVVVALLEGAGYGVAAKNAFAGFLAGFALSLAAGWLLWALIAAGIANRLGERARPAEMARPLAYAGLPRILALLGFLPCAGWLFRAAGWVLALALGAAALRAILQLDRGRALVACLFGLAGYFLLSVVTGWFTNGFGLFGM